jgi:hypothetical protein
MTQQYMGHMTKARYDRIAQLVEHSPGTRRPIPSFRDFLLLRSDVLLSLWADVRLFHPSHRSSIKIRQKYTIIIKYPFPTIFYCDEEFSLFSLTILSVRSDHLVNTQLSLRNMPMPLSLENHSQ